MEPRIIVYLTNKQVEEYGNLERAEGLIMQALDEAGLDYHGTRAIEEDDAIIP